eukprot:m.243273 g.243273  ORF g.243273 m.243273 type:complete len:967 (-) comp33809_c0_seq7:360-3260(-)
MGTAASRDTLQVQDVRSNRSSTKSKTSNNSVGSRRISPRKSSFDLAQDVQTGTAGVDAFMSGLYPNAVSPSRSRRESTLSSQSATSHSPVKPTRSPESQRIVVIASDVIKKTKPPEASKRLRVEYEADGTTRITRVPKKKQQNKPKKHPSKHPQPVLAQKHRDRQHENRKPKQTAEKQPQRAITPPPQPTEPNVPLTPPPPLQKLPGIDPPETTPSSSDESLNRTLLGDIEKLANTELDVGNIDLDQSSTSIISRMVEVRPKGTASSSPQFLPYLITPATTEGAVGHNDPSSNTDSNPTTNNTPNANSADMVSKANGVARENNNSDEEEADSHDVFPASSSLTPQSHSHPHLHFEPKSISRSQSLSLLLSQSLTHAQSQSQTRSPTREAGIERSSSLMSLLLHTASHADPTTTLLSIIEDIGGSHDTPTPWKRQIEGFARLETLLGINAPVVAQDIHATVLATLCEIRNARSSVVVAATRALTTMVQKLGTRMDEHADEIVSTLLLKASANAGSSLIVNAVAKAIDGLAANVSPEQGLHTFCKFLQRRTSTTAKMLAAAALTTVVDGSGPFSDNQNEQLFQVATGLVENSANEISDCGDRILTSMKTKAGWDESAIDKGPRGDTRAPNNRHVYAREETYLSSSHHGQSEMVSEAGDQAQLSDGVYTSHGLKSEPTFTLNQTWSLEAESPQSRLNGKLPPPQDSTFNHREINLSPSPVPNNNLHTRGSHRKSPLRKPRATIQRANSNILSAAEKLCSSGDWRQREKGILKLDQLLEDTENVEKVDVVLLFKKILVPRCVELNVKVALNALCLAVKLIPLFHQDFDPALSKFLVIELSKAFSSTNAKILDATSMLFDHIIVYCDSSKLLKPWVITVNPERHSKVASAMMVKLRKLVALTYSDCPQEHRRIVVPCACRFWVSTKLKHETKLLLRVLLGVMGEDLIEAAKGLPLATQSALRDFVEREHLE